MTTKDSYKQMWERIGENKSEVYFDYKFVPTHRVGLTNYLRENLIYIFLDPHKDDVVFDVGCASGRQLFKIADKIKAGYGIDIAQSFIDKANREKEKKGVNNLYFQQATIETLSFPDEMFDKVICAEVLEHVDDANLALGEILRVLKKDGVLILTVPNLNADATLWGRLMRLIGVRKFKPISEFSIEELQKHGDTHVREFDHKTITTWLFKNGIEVIDIKSVSFIDGPAPYFDFLLKCLLHITPVRWFIIKIENLLTNLNLFFGRHLIVKGIKK
jgi:ubiquinone/menaquinone biosynthesis C-methylase UbiE